MIFLTGGSGLLGQEIQKHIECHAPSHKDFDILNPYLSNPPDNVNLVVHGAAYTDVAGAEEDKKTCYNANVLGTRNVALWCSRHKLPLLYISTEYVFDGEKGNYDEEDYPNPRNFYALTKLLGEYEARNTHSVVLRCLFKPRPFEHDRACTNQFTTGGYVDEIAPEVVRAIHHFNELPKTIHIGFERTSTYQLAKVSRPDIIGVSVESIGTVLPKDTSLDTTLWRYFKYERGLC